MVSMVLRTTLVNNFATPNDRLDEQRQYPLLPPPQENDVHDKNEHHYLVSANKIGLLMNFTGFHDPFPLSPDQTLSPQIIRERMLAYEYTS